MNDNPVVRFARLERAPAYKIVSDAILKDIIGGTVADGQPASERAEACRTVRRQPLDCPRGYPAPGGDRRAASGIRQAARGEPAIIR